ncbi:hypothetical protein [Paraburkholderia sp.]|uniref:hypothetical protein n=1 Tax=Paraburkholderia sp. TaxID=1926495 RepID=UPI0025F13B50|nr:hypothetical protein [Paraburkholderia sp.]
MKEADFLEMLARISVTHSADDNLLLITAADAREMFDWPVSAEKSASRLQIACPGLRLVSIEDDYLDERWMAAFESALAPVRVKWLQAMLIDGRHGR